MQGIKLQQPLSFFDVDSVSGVFGKGFDAVHAPRLSQSCRDIDKQGYFPQPRLT
jgi:hypothetical protein